MGGLIDKAGLAFRLGGMRRRERWSRSQIEAWQARTLERLRRHALSHSPFYARFHSGLADAPLAELPVLTKAQLMEHFDDLVTDRTIRLRDVEAFATQMGPLDLFRERYQVVTTSGTTGRRAFMLFAPDEWRWVMASLPRIMHWHGIDTSAPNAMITTHVPWHMSARCASEAGRLGLGAGRASLDCAAGTEALVASLNDLEPVTLSGYPSMLALLAENRRNGQLRIAPRHIFCTSECLTPDMANSIATAFGVTPANIYALSEAGAIASTCTAGDSLHVADDMCILESVDENNRPVPPGTTGEKTLLTVLFNRTMPLIRYEITDRIAVAAEPCSCGRQTTLLARVDGRSGDMLRLPGSEGCTIAIAPAQISAFLRGLRISGWQLTAGQERLQLAVVTVDQSCDADLIASRLARGLADLGAVVPSISVEPVVELERGLSGKVTIMRAVNGEKIH
ncbi:MAG: phenylacetate--CoA ligase family protein [Bradyrhizobium sp.]|uniref:phenylacetate--CoA ligase family protein n=1 Tax=Bradyrhizobium sp. TaxID=376 RepID=UPI002A2F9896|nr:phenylacetate--CoA ligase family protein [Bradyrhizobium sp.]